MGILVGRKAPDFTTQAVLSDGTINDSFNFHEAIKGKYGVLFFYPMDFTFVCPSELIALSNRYDALNALGRRRKLARGQTLVWAGEESLVCANLLSGVLKLSAVTPDGREQVVGLLYPADFVGRPWAELADFTVTALGDVELCVFPRKPFERVLEDHARMERLLLQRTLAALDEARGRMLALARLSAREKLAGFLLDLADRTRG
ncbi:MAG: cyclic nucleotide-binding domain-containing protein, partial [Bosea sp.]|uniref:cyclic nucleotide-binding domain-containing protein n=1 Tax=Bosea sp. (in: a-proteobacteria) TaxID=1871050 RepID=UPI00239E6352|nr:cyclic nucleotide-binding domain-containing protein [Bosea sp. (in: a-proteobacteria)]